MNQIPGTHEPTRSTDVDDDAQSSSLASSTPSIPGRDSSTPPPPAPSSPPPPTATPTNNRPVADAVASPAGQHVGDDAATAGAAHEPAKSSVDDRNVNSKNSRHGAVAQQQQPGGLDDDDSNNSNNNDDTALSTANDREATELAAVGARRRSTMEAMDEGEEVSVSVSEVATAADECCERERRRCELKRQRVGWGDVARRWWRRQVSVTVEAGGMRDHLGEFFSRPPSFCGERGGCLADIAFQQPLSAPFWATCAPPSPSP